MAAKEAADPGDRDKLVQDFRSIVKRLIIDHGLSVKALENQIALALREESMRLPPVKVLFNDNSGNFSLSNDIISYSNKVLDDSPREDDRIWAAKLIPKYGRVKAERYATIFRAILLYKHHNLKAKEPYYRPARALFTSINRINNIRDKILSLPVTSFRGVKTFKLDPTRLTTDISDWLFDPTDYSRQDLLDSLWMMMSQHRLSYDRQVNQLGIFQSGQWTEKLLSYEPLGPQLDGEIEDISFAEAVETFGEFDENIWSYQNSFNSVFMRFLVDNLVKNNNVDFFTGKEIQASSDLFEECYVAMGLLFASGPGCHLSMCDAPPFAWLVTQDRKHSKEEIKLLI